MTNTTILLSVADVIRSHVRGVPAGGEYVAAADVKPNDWVLVSLGAADGVAVLRVDRVVGMDADRLGFVDDFDCCRVVESSSLVFRLREGGSVAFEDALVEMVTGFDVASAKAYESRLIGVTAGDWVVIPGYSRAAVVRVGEVRQGHVMEYVVDTTRYAWFVERVHRVVA